jgi:hypothetical protein
MKQRPTLHKARSPGANWYPPYLLPPSWCDLVANCYELSTKGYPGHFVRSECTINTRDIQPRFRLISAVVADVTQFSATLVLWLSEAARLLGIAPSLPSFRRKKELQGHFLERPFANFSPVAFSSTESGKRRFINSPLCILILLPCRVWSFPSIIREVASLYSFACRM